MLRHLKAFREIGDYTKLLERKCSRRKIPKEGIKHLIEGITINFIDLADCSSMQVTSRAEQTYIFGPDLMKQINALNLMLYNLAEKAAFHGMDLRGYDTLPKYCKESLEEESADKVGSISKAGSRILAQETIGCLVDLIVNYEDDTLENQEATIYKAFFNIISTYRDKSGVLLLDFFEELHKANMRKVVDGKIMMNDNGEPLIPKGWEGPEKALIQHVRRVVTPNKI